MKLRDEVKERWGLVVPDDAVWYEDDDMFVTKGGMGVNRNTETFWRNRDFGDENPESLEQIFEELPQGRDLRRSAEQVGKSFRDKRRDDAGESDSVLPVTRRKET